MFAILAETALVGLKLWASKESTKYIDKIARLKKAYYETENADRVDHAHLDNLEFELRITCEAFNSQATSKNPAS